MEARRATGGVGCRIAARHPDDYKLRRFCVKFVSRAHNDAGAPTVWRGQTIVFYGRSR
jgi:hypothetical protein